MNKVAEILNRFPQYAYDLGDESSILYKLIKSIADEFDVTMDNINRINNMLSIDNVLPDDLYNRFGALLNIRQNKNESDEQYRNRLRVSVTSLSGGTAEAIKYAIACGLGINNDPIAMDKIHIYDAWEYNGEADSVTKEYGYVVCDIDLDQRAYSVDTEEIVRESADNVKAAGVIIQFVYRNYRVSYYAELDDMTYASFGTLVYNKVGEEYGTYTR